MDQILDRISNYFSSHIGDITKILFEADRFVAEAYDSKEEDEFWGRADKFPRLRYECSILVPNTVALLYCLQE